jgi:hypothetical protein
MDPLSTTVRLARAAAVATVVGHLARRPQMLPWGATAQEAGEALPGETSRPTLGCKAPARSPSTRPRSGYGRGSFRWASGGQAVTPTTGWSGCCSARVRRGLESATRIHPELQHLAVGDRIYLGGGVHAPATEVEPLRHLVAREAFVLRPVPGTGPG